MIVAARRGERGSILIVALLVMVLLFLLGMTLLGLSSDQRMVAANEEWGEGAFFAAEAAVQQAMDGITDTSVEAPPAVATTTFNQRYTFRTGRKTDTSAQAPTLLAKVTRSGFSVGSTTGYNPSSRFYFYIYQVNGTGLGPRNTSREVEVQLEYGPVSR